MMLIKDLKRICEICPDDVEVYIKLPNGKIEELSGYFYKMENGGLYMDLPKTIKFKEE